MTLSWKGREFQRQRAEVGRERLGSWILVQNFSSMIMLCGWNWVTILEAFYFQIYKIGLMKLPPHRMAAPRTITSIPPSTLHLSHLARYLAYGRCPVDRSPFPCAKPMGYVRFHILPTSPKDQQCKMHERKTLEVKNKLLTLSLAFFFHHVLSPVPTVPHVELKSLVVRAGTQKSDSGPNPRAAS